MTIKINIKSNKSKSTLTIASKRDLLYGTGATKKLGTFASKKITTLLDLQASLDAGAKKAIIPEFAKSTINSLPSALLAENIILDKSQQPAVDGLIHQKYGCLIGSAGTGKTTTIKALLVALEKRNINNNLLISFCSFTGKAVQQMKRALPKKYHYSANTIHATLGFKPEIIEIIDEVTGGITKSMRFVPTFNKLNKLACKVIIIDETGTVPTDLWRQLYAALPEDCVIIMLGDLGQLPPVAGHSILGFAMLKWPTYELTTLHRNAGEIAIQSHRVLQGFKPLSDTNEKVKTIVVKKISDGSIGAKKELLGIIRYLHEAGKFDPILDGIIVPMNIGELGQIGLNNILVNQFNPPILDKETKLLTNPRVAIKTGRETKVFAVGDKIMLLKNDTDTGMTNGMQGIIVAINPNTEFTGNIHIVPNASKMKNIDLSSFDTHLNSLDISGVKVKDKSGEPEKESERAASHIITVKFQDVKETMTFSTSGEISNITLSYAFTCHKAQGSEFRFVIVLCHSANMRMLCREWLYTAMTRAKTQLLVLCNNRGLSHAVGTQRIKGNTIKEKAQKFIDLQAKLSDKDMPRLPDAEKIINVNGNIKFKL